MWPIITSLILPKVAQEFGQKRPPLLSLAQNLGLLAGAMFWGFGWSVTLYQSKRAGITNEVGLQ